MNAPVAQPQAGSFAALWSQAVNWSYGRGKREAAKFLVSSFPNLPENRSTSCSYSLIAEPDFPLKGCLSDGLV